MFRRLAQLEAFDSGQAQINYTQDQTYQYNTFLPRFIPTNSSYPAPNQLQQALQNVNPVTGAAIDVVQEPQRLFRPAGAPASLNTLQQSCLNGSLDQLVNSQDPSRKIRCGWMYTAPVKGSPIPQLSQGYLGTPEGPLTSLGTVPTYTSWYWDLKQAQQQVRTDVCKSLQNCSDVATDPYNGNCGYCTDIGQGIPVDNNGNALYPNSPLTQCSAASLISGANVANCPAPSSGGGPSPQTNNTCVPNASGQLSVGCLTQVLGQAGCTDQGALSLALSTGATPTNYMTTAQTLSSMSLYNKTAQPPFNVNLYSQGQGTVAAALSEAQNLYANTATNTPTSALGASARDLCLQKGAIDNYDFCSELSPTTPISSVDPTCLQKAFLKAGGTPDGTMYPTTTTTSGMAALNYITTNLGTWNGFQTMLSTLVANAKGPATAEGFRVRGKKEGFQNMYGQVQTAYQTQSVALQQLRGITPDALITNRAPYSPGVEVFWVSGYNIIGYNLIASLTQIGVNSSVPSSFFFTLSDYRVTQDTDYKFISQAIPISSTLNKSIFEDPVPTDIDGSFRSMNSGAPTACWSLQGGVPNILKLSTANVSNLQFIEASCGASSGQQLAVLPSLTRELTAPTFMFELDPLVGRTVFQDLRYSDMFPTSLTAGTSANGRTDDILKSPAGINNGYLTVPGGSGAYIVINTIGFGILNTLTFTFNTTTTPLGNILFILTSPADNTRLVVYMMNDGYVYYNTSAGATSVASSIKTSIQIIPSLWYACVVQLGSWGTNQWTVNIVPLSVAQNSITDLTNPGQTTSFTVRAPNGGQLIQSPFTTAYFQIGDGSSDYILGLANNSAFALNVGWVHAFTQPSPSQPGQWSNIATQTPSKNDLYRDFMNNWIITRPPAG